MNWLLKVVDGPMKGAEIALVNGLRLKFGSSPDCDIVIADASLGGVAFELDVSESGVTMVEPGGEAVPLTAFEIRDVGTTAFAIGPEEGKWDELTRPEPKTESPSAEETASSETAPAETAPSESAAAEPAEEPPAESSVVVTEKRKPGFVWIVVAVLILLLALLLFNGWRRHARRVTDAARQAETAHVVTLRDIADEHGLRLDESGGKPVLSGNLSRRTERQAIRALALATDDRVSLDLTDDESLLVAANELLFACTDGAMKAVAATNRAVTVAGYAPDVKALERAIRALAEDVKGLERLDTAAVTVGGNPPKGVAGSAFAATGAAHEPPVKPLKPRTDYPIAGILTTPYPCVVLRDGLRLAEGAQIGSAVLVRIEADRLTLKEGAREFEWRP